MERPAKDPRQPVTGDASGARPFLPGRTLEVLHRHEVAFIVIGGIAGRAFGSPSYTNDLDRRDKDKIELQVLGASREEGDRS